MPKNGSIRSGAKACANCVKNPSCISLPMRTAPSSQGRGQGFNFYAEK
jgi:hypothetical protein